MCLPLLSRSSVLSGKSWCARPQLFLFVYDSPLVLLVLQQLPPVNRAFQDFARPLSLLFSVILPPQDSPPPNTPGYLFFPLQVGFTKINLLIGPIQVMMMLSHPTSFNYCLRGVDRFPASPGMTLLHRGVFHVQCVLNLTW